MHTCRTLNTQPPTRHKPDTHISSAPGLCRHQSTLPSMWACRSAPGRVRQPSGSVPSWNLSREAQCVIFKQKESSSLTAGRKSRVCGWVGGWARGHVRGGGHVCKESRHVNNRACVLGHGAHELGAFRLGAFRLGGGRSRGNRVCLCEGVCVCAASLCAVGVGVCLPVSAFSLLLDF